MSQSRDPVFAAAQEYENATLDALQALNGTDVEAQVAACVRWADAAAAIDAMPEDDYGRAGTYLTLRGRVPDHAWRLILAAMERLDEARD